MLDVPPGALWIGPSHPFDLHEAYLCFRSPAGWALSDRPERADLYVTADSRYRLWANGRFVARGPARCYPQRQSVDRLDLAPHLQAGENLLAVQVYQPGYSHFAYVHRAAAGLLAWLVLDDRVALVSDGDWRMQRDPSFRSPVRRVSIYGSGVEERDLSLDSDWAAPGYDDCTWEAARVVAPAGGYPWTGLAPRDLPLLVERELDATLIQFWTAEGATACCSDPHSALLESWRQAVRQDLPADEQGWLRADLGSGRSAFWLFDLGRDRTCQAWAEVRDAGGQEQFAVSYAEKLREGQVVLSDPGTYCRVRMTDRFALRPGDQVVQGFSLRGGRYVLYWLQGPAGARFRWRPRVTASEYPLEVSRPLPLDAPDLAEIMGMCETTALACLQDGFVDSVWRESSQWVGDALPQALVLASMSDDTRPLRHVVRMAAEGAYPDGVLPSVLPGEVHAYAIVDYNFTWVELLALDWRLTGDAAFLRSMWPTLATMLERFGQDVGDDGLIRSQPGRRLFLDWAPVSRHEPSAIYNLRYLLALQVAVRLAADRGKWAEDQTQRSQGRGQEAVPVADVAARWQERGRELAQTVRAAFWDGRRWWDDRQRTTYSQLAAALALLAGCVEDHEVGALLDAVVVRSLDTNDESAPGTMVLASPFMHHYLFEALRGHGRHETVVEIVRRRWGRWTRAGYPTTWENWNVDFPDGSQCHAFSAHPRYHLAEIMRGTAGDTGRLGIWRSS